MTTESDSAKANFLNNLSTRFKSFFPFNRSGRIQPSGPRKFSTVLMVTIISLVTLFVVVILFVLNRYFDERVVVEFQKKLHAEKGQVEILIKNRLDDIKKVLNDLSTDNTIRVTMMLDAQSKILDRMKEAYSPEDGVYSFIRMGNSGLITPQSYSTFSKETVLSALYVWPRGDVIPDKDTPRLLWVFSQPIVGTEGNMGTATVLYDMLEDTRLIESVKAAVKGDLRFIYGERLIPLGEESPDASGAVLSDMHDENEKELGFAGNLAYSQILSNRNLYYISSAMELLSERKKVTLLMWFFSAVVLAVSVLISAFLAGKMVRPLNEMTRKAIRISEGNDIPLNFERNNEYWEFDQLSEAFNTMFAHLKEAEERSRYQELLENVDDAVYIIDETGAILDANSATYEPLGYSRENFINLQLKNIVPSDEHTNIIKLGKLEQDHTGLKKLTIETFHLGKDGQSIPVEIQSRAITYLGKRVILNVARDITERVEAEKHKAFLESQLNHAQKMEALGTMAGCIAHDFNNLLMGIQASVDMLSLDMKPEQQAYSRLAAIEKTIASASSLTRQLLGFARREKGEFEPLNVNTLVEESTGLFIKSRKEIKLGLEFDAGVRPVSADRGQLEQVLVNLCINAWHAMPKGGELNIYTRNITLDDMFCKPFELCGGDYVYIGVADTGVGMSSETMEKIFDPFFTTKEPGKGTGLGLASAYGIIMNHKGIITVESKVGKGTMFNIYLPSLRSKQSV